MPKIQLSEVKETLKERIKADNLISILRFVKKEKPSLWGTTKKKGHLEKSVLLAIYKDVEGKGYTDLFNSTKHWMGNGVRSLMHNTQALRPILAKWGSRSGYNRRTK